MNSLSDVCMRLSRDPLMARMRGAVCLSPIQEGGGTAIP